MDEKRTDDTPMIELHKVDTAMAYAGKIVKDVKVIVITCLAAMIVIVTAIVYIFVSKYNARTSDWLRTFETLKNGQTVTEVSDGNTEEIQQLPPA